MSKIIPGYTKVAAGDFTQNAAPGVTNVLTDSINGLNIKSTNTAAGSVWEMSSLTKVAPATPYCVTAHFINYGDQTKYTGYGLIWRQSSDGKCHSLINYPNGSTVAENIAFRKWSDATHPADYFYVSNELWDPKWFRIVDDGANRISYISTDGINWKQEHSIGRTDYITANQIGICFDPIYQTTIVLITCDHFKVDYSG